MVQIIFNRPGRRPGDTPNRASFLPKRFFSTGDEIRGLIRVPCEEAQLLFRSFRRRGYINGHDRSNNTRVRFYVRPNTTLDQFVLSLPKRLTALDRVDAGWVPPQPSLYARGLQLTNYFESERRSLFDSYVDGLGDIAREFHPFSDEPDFLSRYGVRRWRRYYIHPDMNI